MAGECEPVSSGRMEVLWGRRRRRRHISRLVCSVHPQGARHRRRDRFCEDTMYTVRTARAVVRTVAQSFISWRMKSTPAGDRVCCRAVRAMANAFPDPEPVVRSHLHPNVRRPHAAARTSTSCSRPTLFPPPSIMAITSTTNNTGSSSSSTSVGPSEHVLLPGQPIPAAYLRDPKPAVGKGCYEHQGRMLSSVIGRARREGQVRPLALTMTTYRALRRGHQTGALLVGYCTPVPISAGAARD